MTQVIPQDAALTQRNTSLSLPGLRYQKNMHKDGPDGCCMTFEDCVSRTLIHYKKLMRHSLMQTSYYAFTSDTFKSQQPSFDVPLKQSKLTK